MKKVLLLLLAASAAIASMAQKPYDWVRLDTLIAKGAYATAYPIAQRYWQQTEQNGSGADRLTAAFYLTALDYAYSKDAADSALMRYSLLARRLQGVDRAVAYAFLFQTYNSLYSKYNYRLDRNKPSDDPNIKYTRWHRQRMEDTLMACADHVLAQADALRRADTHPYRRLLRNSINNETYPDSSSHPSQEGTTFPPLDTTLLGILVQTLLEPSEQRIDLASLASAVRDNVLKPMFNTQNHPGATANSQFSILNSEFPYPLSLHRRVAELYASSPADTRLWLDLQRYEVCYSSNIKLLTLDSLVRYYRPLLATDDMRAMLCLRQAENFDFNRQCVKAEQLCLETERRYPNTYGAYLCRQLRRDICQQRYELHYNQTESSKRHRMAVVEACNISLLKFKIVSQQLLEDSWGWKKHADTLLRLPSVAQWQQPLPDPGDHLTHSYLIALPHVPQGDYYLVAYTDSSLCYEEYQSADAAFFAYYTPLKPSRHSGLSPSQGHLVDRTTGQPLAYKRVTLHSYGEITNLHYRLRRRTDSEGFFRFPTSSLRYVLTEPEVLAARVEGYETEYGSEGYYDVFTGHTYHQNPKRLEIVMTDRPVYRLGDTVHFSCVAYLKHSRGKEWKSHLRPAKNVKLIATFSNRYDDNEDTLHLVTDSHGRCWGEFIIPADGQNGYYDLTVKSTDYNHWGDRNYYDNQRIKVEAYKQPHFMLSLSTTKDSADSTAVRRFGQPVTFYGNVASYSGAPMTGTRIKWEVSCEPLTNPLQANTVANDFPFSDSLTVDEEGNFQFSFTPTRDTCITSNTSSTSPTRNSRKETSIYTAYVRAIDADGEMHEQHLSLHVSDADGYCMPTGDDLSHLTFAYNNFDHQPLKGAVRVVLQQLRQPDTILTLDTLMKKYPDARWVGTREEFQHLFPYRAFSREEGDKHSWPVVATRFNQTTEARKLDIPNLPSGLYRVTFYTPDSNQHDTLINYVAPNGRVTGDDIVWLRTTPQRDWTYTPSLTCRVGDTVRIELGSPYGNQPLFYRIDHAAKCYRRGMLVLDSSHTSTLVIPITKRMLDGCVVTLAAMREGRSFAIRYAINVLRPDLRLDIGIETFRDRMQPGEQEQWRLRVTQGDTFPKGIESNLSLTMYDLALEEYGHLKYGFWPWRQEYYNDLQIPRPHIESKRMSYTVKTPLLPHNPTITQPRIGFALPEVANYHKQLIARFGVSITGTIIDIQTQEPLPFVNVVVKYGNGTVKGTTTDLDGNFALRGVPAGEYTIIVSSVGYGKLEQRITVPSNGARVLNIAMSPTASKLEEVQILESKVPVIEIGAPESGARMSADDIAHMPGTSVESIVASVGGVGYARGENGMVTMQGGVRKRTGVNVPKEAIAEIPPMFNFGSTATDMASSMRKNLSTLALFEPALRSDKEGYATVSFTLPDILTQWRLYGFAWTDQFQVGTLNRTIQAQKELMVQPLMPRFLRQGDTIEIRAKVSNLTDSVMEVLVGFEIENGELNVIENGEWRMENYPGAATNSQLTISPRSSTISTTRIAVPADWHVADYKVYAYKTTSGGHLSDGEQGQLPVLSNRERITTSHLIYVPGSVDGKEIVRTFDIALPTPAPGDSTILTFTANPIQYAIEALPHFKRLLMPGNIYLANSIYVNHLTTLLDTLSPKEKQRVASRVTSDLHRILGAQASGGGWSWMPGGREASRYVTESVLQRLASCPSLDNQNNYHNQYLRAIAYLDKLLVDINKDMMIYSHPWFDDYLSLTYTRSLYFNTKPLDQCDSTTQEAYRFCYRMYKMRSNDYTNLHTQSQLALLMLHMGDTADAISLATRIKESAHTSDDQGMYWLNNVSGYGWYQRPIETAALLVDVFADVLHDWESVNRIQQWILASKRGTTWRTDMATAAALHALLRQPTSTTINQGTVTIKCNNKIVESGELKVESNPNTPANSQLSTLNFQLNNTSPLPAWGALFHSHDTPIDSIQYNGTGMKLRKTLSRVNSDGSLTLLNPGDKLHVGDRVRVHIDIDCQQGFDNMVLRDQRAATFEPASTTSGWQWNNGLRYYVDVRDEWTDCYIDHLSPEHYYVEYDLWVRHSGTFANGICTLQSVYAPEFRANTDSQNILVP